MKQFARQLAALGLCAGLLCGTAALPASAAGAKDVAGGVKNALSWILNKGDKGNQGGASSAESGSAAADPTVLTDLRVSIQNAGLVVGETTALAVTPIPATANITSVSLTSSNERVAVVDGSGQVTGIAPGSAEITVTANGISRSVGVTVSVRTENIRLNSTYVVLKPGATYQLSGSVTPAEAPQALTYTSQNSEIAAVSDSGLITAKATGSTAVVVSNGPSKALVSVIVNRTASASSAGQSTAEPPAPSEPEQLFAGEESEVVLTTAQLPVLDTALLAALSRTDKTLTLTGENYTLRLNGRDIRNAANEMSTALDFHTTDKGLAFALNDAGELPGKVTVTLPAEAAARYQKVYLYNTYAEKWQLVRAKEGDTLTLTTAGQYLLREKSFVTWGVNWIMVAASGILLGVMAGCWVYFKKRYWFW